MKVFIDANNGILGRVAAKAAKTALNGDEVLIFNVEKIVVSGNRKYLEERYLQRIHRGESVNGPFFPRTSMGIVKRAIRGMLPHKTGRGRQAFKRIKVYNGVPSEFSSQKMDTPVKTKQDFNSKNYLTIKQISNRLGGQ